MLLTGCGSSQPPSPGTTAAVRTGGTASPPTANTQSTISRDQLRAPPAAHITSLQALESQLAAFSAELGATEDEPATPAQIAADTQRLSVTCGTPTFDQIPCVVNLKGASRAINACSVPATGRRQLLLMHCDGGSVPPITRRGYVDCATTGPLTSVADPVGDTVNEVPAVRGDRSVPTRAPWTDLTEVRLSATSKRLCVDFKTVARPRAGETFSINIYKSGSSVTHGGTLATPMVVLGTGTGPEVETAPMSPTTGQAGTAGDWTSLVMNTRDFGDQPPSFLGRAFAFQAHASYQTYPRGRTGLYLQDSTRPAAFK
jgi:hypothetical protein